MKSNRLNLILAAVLMLTPAFASDNSTWQSKLKQELPLLGHRNWIVIADAAYPWQTAPGVETVATGSGQLEVMKEVLAYLAKTTHVKPIIYTDSELPFVSEKNAPGIEAYRDALHKIIGTREIQSLPHEQIIGKLDEAGKTFHVLLLKTNHTQPYTSVFLQLDCGYWSPAKEKELRDAMAATPKS